jgi:hypothetical protein
MLSGPGDLLMLSFPSFFFTSTVCTDNVCGCVHSVNNFTRSFTILSSVKTDAKIFAIVSAFSTSSVVNPGFGSLFLERFGMPALVFDFEDTYLPIHADLIYQTFLILFLSLPG